MSTEENIELATLSRIVGGIQDRATAFLKKCIDRYDALQGKTDEASQVERRAVLANMDQVMEPLTVLNSVDRELAQLKTSQAGCQRDQAAEVAARLKIVRGF